MSEVTEKNKRLVLEGFDTLFNKRDYAAAERFWAPNYIQHSAHRAGARRIVQPSQEPSADSQIRVRDNCVGERFRHRSRTILGSFADELGGGRHSSYQ
jgi:hypothetical protein